MTTRVEAVYHDGILQPRHPLPFADGTEVDVLVLSDDARESHGKAYGSQTPARLMAEIAGLAIEGKTDEFSGADHDRILYGGR
jgi:predicted DNA-binding antitoxin AbrB/MazE fold protein